MTINSNGFVSGTLIHSINGLIPIEKIKVGDLELSGVKLLFKNEKLSEWDAWESMSLENFMKVVGTYVEKYGDNFYFSDYGESGCTFTYFGSQGLIQIGGKMNKEKKVN